MYIYLQITQYIYILYNITPLDNINSTYRSMSIQTNKEKLKNEAYLILNMFKQKIIYTHTYIIKNR